MVDVPEGEARDGLLVGGVGLPYLQKKNLMVMKMVILHDITLVNDK